MTATTPTTFVMAEGSYDWWRAEVAARDEEIGRLRALVSEYAERIGKAEARAEHAEGAAQVNRERANEQRRRADELTRQAEQRRAA